MRKQIREEEPVEFQELPLYWASFNPYFTLGGTGTALGRLVPEGAERLNHGRSGSRRGVRSGRVATCGALAFCVGSGINAPLLQYRSIGFRRQAADSHFLIFTVKIRACWNLLRTPVTESSSQTPSKPAPPPGPPCGCARRSPDSPRRSRSSAAAHGRQ